MKTPEVAKKPLDLLELLADGNIHSGQELANLYGVSRTAIWKQVEKLKSLGLQLHSISGRGYFIEGGVDLLSREQIFSKLEQSSIDQIAKFKVLRLVDSTNTFLLAQPAAQGIMICLAEGQSAGQGRRGREWVSPFGKNIYLSFKITLECGVGAIEGLSLAIGVAVARSLSRCGIVDVQLKWPNDVLWRERKLAGILVEVVGDPAGLCHVVAGVGLNISNDKAMNEGIDQPWVSLMEIAEKVQVDLEGRNLIAARLINELVGLLVEFGERGFEGYREEWKSLSAHAGKEVYVHIGSTVVSGIMVGVNSIGALMLLTDKGMQLFHGGEVSLRVDLHDIRA